MSTKEQKSARNNTHAGLVADDAVGGWRYTADVGGPKGIFVADYKFWLWASIFLAASLPPRTMPSDETKV